MNPASLRLGLGLCLEAGMGVLVSLSIGFFQSLVDMAPKYILEQFLQQELLINITEHEVGS